MPSLHEMQLEFMQRLFTREYAQAPAFIRREHTAAEQGFTAYRNNVYGSLRHTLRGIYPVVERLVGRDFFGFAADAYIDSHASQSGDLNQYGGEFPGFLFSFPPAKDLPYLTDVATLEWACHVAHDAADAAPVAIRDLATVPAEDYGRLTFRLHPSVRLLRSRYPTLAIWEKNQPRYAGDQCVDLHQGGDDLLIWRTHQGVDVAPLPAAEWTFLSLLTQGECLQEAFDRLLKTDAAFDLAATLRKYCGNGVLVDFTHPSSVTEG